MMENRYQKLSSYLNYVSKHYNVQICIKDYCGFIPFHRDLSNAVQPFLSHSNPFCSYIKSEQKSYYDCLSMITKTKKKCDCNCNSFIGMCHAGISEYVIPIKSQNTIIGTINIGCFSHDELKSKHRIRRLCENSKNLDYCTALKLFYKSLNSNDYLNDDFLLSTLELIAEYFALAYNHIQFENGSISHKHYSSNEDTILFDALSYIRENYPSKITIRELSSICHCSDSHLSHIFKRRVGVNIITYINKFRIEDAKIHLESSNISISEIALNTGFNDPNYFSRIFMNLVGISPKEYRRRFQHNAYE